MDSSDSMDYLKCYRDLGRVKKSLLLIHQNHLERCYFLEEKKESLLNPTKSTI